MKIFVNGKWQVLATAGGFMDVAPHGKVTILADSAVRVEEINLAKVEAAKKRAENELKRDLSSLDFIRVSSDLRRSLIELKSARKHRHRIKL